MHCSSCAMNIEWELEDNGIKSKCSYAAQALEVDPEVDESKLKKIVSKLGYQLLP